MEFVKLVRLRSFPSLNSQKASTLTLRLVSRSLGFYMPTSSGGLQIRGVLASGIGALIARSNRLRPKDSFCLSDSYGKSFLQHDSLAIFWCAN